MRKLSLIALAVAFGGIFGCEGAAPPSQATEPEASLDQPTAPSVGVPVEVQSPPETYDRLESLELPYLDDQFVGELFELRNIVPTRPLVPDNYLDQFERGLPLRENWMNCTRYLTNNAMAGFCEDEPPANWRPFEFNDERYYFVPLGPSA
jgi:hypothetical protein